MMEPSDTKKLNHGSTHLLDLWDHSIHRHHHSNYVSLHLQNLRKDEVCSKYFINASFATKNFKSFIDLIMNELILLHTHYSIDSVAEKKNYEWLTSASFIRCSSKTFFRGVQLDQDSDVDDVFTL